MWRKDVASRGSGVTANKMASAHMAVRIPRAVASAPAAGRAERYRSRHHEPRGGRDPAEEMRRNVVSAEGDGDDP